MIRLHVQLKAEERAALTLGFDESGQRAEDAILPVELQPITRGERLLYRAAAAQERKNVVPPLAEFRRR